MPGAGANDQGTLRVERSTTTGESWIGPGGCSAGDFFLRPLFALEKATPKNRWEDREKFCRRHKSKMFSCDAAGWDRNEKLRRRSLRTDIKCSKSPAQPQKYTKHLGNFQRMVCNRDLWVFLREGFDPAKLSTHMSGKTRRSDCEMNTVRSFSMYSTTLHLDWVDHLNHFGWLLAAESPYWTELSKCLWSVDDFKTKRLEP